MSDCSVYTIGWICAIEPELIAALELLDKRHDQPEGLPPNDTNAYVLGEMGGHKIVIASLPDGEYGISKATDVAVNLARTFPNVRLGLMVGIGGGAPRLPTNDIRLGDVVVSSAKDGGSGVYQYDFGKTIQDKEFISTGQLDKPPKTFRTAISVLKADHRREGNSIHKQIELILEKNSRLKDEYQRPEETSDRLYRSEYTHCEGKATCDDCGDKESTIVTRTSRSQRRDNPAIHYGLIASANQLMKNALIRDKLAKENNVLCFETEAAGLMDHFPCLVIRGICSYADTHKNKEWQGYAAMAAAVYAKELLGRIPPRSESSEERPRNMKLLVDEVRKDRLSIRLSPDFSTDFYHLKRSCCQGTGQWFL
ncbi:nucleoside phosphorylase domain-containing protein [Daldinia sp. FL1419]|nr:nucleoside phosphorylase domain-containing protein [Daldinia sp. FL1419]